MYSIVYDPIKVRKDNSKKMYFWCRIKTLEDFKRYLSSLLCSPTAEKITLGDHD